MRKVLIFLILLILTIGVSARFVADYDARDLNTIEYYPSGLNRLTPTSFKEGVSNLNFINGVIPTFNNIDFISTSGLSITSNDLNSEIVLGIASDLNLTNVQASNFFGGSFWGDGSNLTGLVTSTTYKPFLTTVSGGTDLTLDINAMKYYDENSYDFQEGNGVNPLDVNIYFSEVDDISKIIIREYYTGSTSHHIIVQLWDYVSEDFEDYADFVGQTGFNILELSVFDATDHIQDGNAIVRLHHIQNGVMSHFLYVDFAWLQKGTVVGASTDLNGFAKYIFGFNDFSGSGNFSTTGDANFANIGLSGIIFGTDANFTTVQADFFFGDGSGLTGISGTDTDTIRTYTGINPIKVDSDANTITVIPDFNTLIESLIYQFDTNAQTVCSGDGNAVLTGNGECQIISEFYIQGAGAGGTDINGTDVNPANVFIDYNLITYGDANFMKNVGIDGNLYVIGELYVNKDSLIIDNIKSKDANSAKGKNAVAIGEGTTAFGANSFAGGQAFSDIVADANASFAFGYAKETDAISEAKIDANGIGSFAQGYVITGGGINPNRSKIISSGLGSFAQGKILNNASGFTDDVIAEIFASGDGSFARGSIKCSAGLFNPFYCKIQALGEGSTASGYINETSGSTSNSSITASGDGSTASGYINSTGSITASGDGSTALGYSTSSTTTLTASGDGSFVGGYSLGGANLASGLASFAFGDGAIASGDSAVAFGETTTALGDISFAMGDSCSTIASSSFCFGNSMTNYASNSVLVNDLNVLGNIYGDGSEITGVSADVNGTDINSSGVFMSGIIKLLVTDSPPACSALLLGGLYFDISEDQPCHCRYDGGAYTWAEIDAQGADCT